jgi:hypothetical protein
MAGRAELIRVKLTMPLEIDSALKYKLRMKLLPGGLLPP